jgi:hypothetical protein
MHVSDNELSFSDFITFSYFFGRGNKPDFPFFYASYKFFEANPVTDHYKFYTMVNFTSRDAVALYPQFMYESILQVALDEPEFEFKTRNTPYPITNVVRERKVQGNAAAVVFITAVAYSMLITSTIGHVVHERVEGHKHM